MKKFGIILTLLTLTSTSAFASSFCSASHPFGVPHQCGSTDGSGYSASTCHVSCHEDQEAVCEDAELFDDGSACGNFYQSRCYCMPKGW